MLRWRLLLGTLIIAALVALGWLDARAGGHGIWLVPAAVAFTVLGTAEVLHLARAGGMRPLAWPVYVGNLLLVLGCWWSPLVGHVEPGAPLGPGSLAAAHWPLVGMALALLLVFVGEMLRYEKPGGILVNTAVAVFGLVYVGVMLGFAVQLHSAWGIGAIASWIIVVKMSDTGAYTVGRLIGRHKLAPRISPGKTIEGAIGALAFACLASWAVFRWLVPLAVPTDVRPGVSWGWLPYGLLLAIAGMVGDLAESMIKRDVGCKDSSTWLPGFGGVLDILDSLLLSAPVAWLCWQLALVGRCGT
jgi:phosphatidate cytidylyltransferase